MNFSAMMKLQEAWHEFTGNHPKFPAFLNALRTQGIHEGDVIAVTVTSPDGKVLENNMRITASDLELFETIKNIKE